MLDKYPLFNDWKKVDEDDWKLLRKVLNWLLKILREDGCSWRSRCIRDVYPNQFVGVESSRPYNFPGQQGLGSNVSFYQEYVIQSKPRLIAYHTELQSALQFVRESSELSSEEKSRFFKSASTNLGTPALCLSGGASFGYFCCSESFPTCGLPPQVITGTSAGGLIAALVCASTDAELKTVLALQLAPKLTTCENTITAHKRIFFTRGSMTFREAYLQTGRILSMSVVPARHATTKFLNYMTAPDTIIWAVLLPSSAVPSILNPVLIQKLHNGRIVPWNLGRKFKDGSLRVDIPPSTGTPGDAHHLNFHATFHSKLDEASKLESYLGILPPWDPINEDREPDEPIYDESGTDVAEDRT
ncbi:hypothetical protein F4604DRAFT_1981190 [Suillus subluteus]|nr:hypothetical protein F4604DRAFT_1981190 [Suillus subluteus]